MALNDNEADSFLLGKGAFDVDDADGEEARFSQEGAVGALVDINCAVG